MGLNRNLQRVTMTTIVSLAALLKSTNLAAAPPALAIYSATAKLSENQVVIAGTGFVSAGSGPVVLIEGKAMKVISFTDQEVVAGIPAGLPAGSYVVTLSLASGKSASVTLSIGTTGTAGPKGPRGQKGDPGTPGAGQIYTGGLNVGLAGTTQWSLTLYGAEQAPFTIVPANCSVRAIFAALVPIPNTNAVSKVSISMLRNSASSDLPVCEVSSAKPVACSLPETPITVSSGDTLGYQITVPASTDSAVSTLVMTLVCQ